MSMATPTRARNRIAPRDEDPYFELARKTHFADYFPTKPPADHPLQVCVEFVPGQPRPAIRGLAMRSAHDRSRFSTGTATLAAIDALNSSPSTVRRILLAEPILPQRARPPVSKPGPVTTPYLPKKTAPIRKPGRRQVLLASLDDACPFAHPFLRRKNGTTRVVRLWDQNPGTNNDPGAAEPAGLAYGREYTAADLNAIMKANRWRDGRVHESSCYGSLNDQFLTRRASHGAHGVGLFAGDRVFDGRPAAHEPVVAAYGSDVAGRSDLVFVKFPTSLMDCVSTTSLEQHAYDGLRYILDTGSLLGYARIVVSFAYESWLGPHDGSSWFEAAVEDLCGAALELGIELKIVMAAGNARKRCVHARIAHPGEGVDLQVAVPPDNEVPTFVELWSPGNDTDLDVSVISPSGRLLQVRQRDLVKALPARGNPRAACPPASVIVHRRPLAGSTLAPALLRIGPTFATEDRQSTAEHGIWTIRLAQSATAVGPLHAYIGRAVADGDSPIRGRQARFVGLTEQQLVEDEGGTLNGHACGKSPTVVGACHDNHFPYAASPFGPMHRHAADYSGSAPGAGPSASRRRAVNVSVSADDGILHAGMLSIGAAAGTVTRFIGTSVATPAYARMLANGRDLATLPRAVVRPHDAAMGSQFAAVRPPLEAFGGKSLRLQVGALPNSALYAASHVTIGRTKKRR